MEPITLERLKIIFIARVDRSGIPAIAKEFGVDQSYVWMIYHGRREISNNIAEKMGYEIVYQEKE